jgi:hypothetical protein
MNRLNANKLRGTLLIAAETVAMRQDIVNLALDAIAAQAGTGGGRS